MISEKFKVVWYVAFGIFIGFSGRYGLDRVYNSMRRGGLTPEMPHVNTDADGNYRRTDVYLVPLGEFSEAAAGMLARNLSEDLGIVVKSTGAMPLPKESWDEKRKQYISDALLRPVHEYGRTLGDLKGETWFIGLLADDMYTPLKNWNFCLTSNSAKGVSVIATDRLVPYAVLNKEKAAKMLGVRMTKLTKRIIGLHYFKYERSSDPESLLYSPLMGVGQLDKMGTEF